MALDAQRFDTESTARIDPEPSGLQVSITVDEEFGPVVDERWLELATKAAVLFAFGRGGSRQLGLLIAGDQTVKELNAAYRGLDEVTDVLSFSPNHQGHWEGEAEGPEDATSIEFVLPPGEAEPLGEVIVSYPQAARQSAEHGVSIGHELAHLIVHGVLHLAGHDHEEPEEASAMHSKEQSALRWLGFKRPVGW